jgi:hypothetical protein
MLVRALALCLALLAAEGVRYFSDLVPPMMG